jgi:hypothetical protein
MPARISISVMLATGIFLSAVRLPAAPCILSNAPSEKACTMGCCKNKSCCETSQQRTGPPAQALAKAGCDQQNIATFAPTLPVAVFAQVATEFVAFPGVECRTHSPPPLALICIRLI